MSNSLAIAAVTRTLRFLLQQRFDANGSGSVTVTTKPPDKARDPAGSNGNQVNVFLYQTQMNADWRNLDMPSVKAGETGHSPLALNLYYLLTAYAEDDDFPEPTSHRLLGEAMSVLHDHAILHSDTIETATAGGEHDLHRQIERVRITTQPLTLDELSKLWTTFQTHYRISAAYEVRVVLIESQRAATAPLPVMRRGDEDTGVTAQADMTPPYPALVALTFTDIETERAALPPSQAALLKKLATSLGDALTLSGVKLEGDTVTVLFNHPLLPSPIAIAPTARSATAIQLIIPATAPEQWLAGFYTVTVQIQSAGQPTRTTNGLPLPLAPEIVAIAPPLRDNSDPTKPNNLILTLTCRPPIAEGQRVSLVLSEREGVLPVSDRELTAQPDFSTSMTTPRTTTTVNVELGDVPAGTYHIRPRLRVDGVDSLVIDYTPRPLVPPLALLPEQDLIIP
jgi:hypothetical protein